VNNGSIPIGNGKKTAAHEARPSFESSEADL
jgi:hypothetical protein